MDIYTKIILWIFSPIWLLGLMGIIFPKFGHFVFRWHRPNKELSSDGVNIKSRCKICNKEIMQDSQGNWF